MMIALIAAVLLVNKPKYVEPYYAEYVYEVCEEYNIDENLILAMIEQESQGDAKVMSFCGAKGLLQVMPKYHKDRMERLGVTDLYDSYSNILVGVDYISELSKTYVEIYDVLMFYNAGYKGLEQAQKGNYSSYALEIEARALEIAELRQ